MQQRPKIESEWQDLYRTHKTNLNQAVGDARISENHAILLTFHDLMKDALGLNQDITDYIYGIAIQKKKECSNREDNLADCFLDIISKHVDEDRKEYALCTEQKAAPSI
jgi:hypothetical protein